MFAQKYSYLMKAQANASVTLKWKVHPLTAAKFNSQNLSKIVPVM